MGDGVFYIYDDRRRRELDPNNFDPCVLHDSRSEDKTGRTRTRVLVVVTCAVTGCVWSCSPEKDMGLFCYRHYLMWKRNKLVVGNNLGEVPPRALDRNKKSPAPLSDRGSTVGSDPLWDKASNKPVQPPAHKSFSNKFLFKYISVIVQDPSIQSSEIKTRILAQYPSMRSINVSAVSQARKILGIRSISNRYGTKLVNYETYCKGCSRFRVTPLTIEQVKSIPGITVEEAENPEDVESMTKTK